MTNGQLQALRTECFIHRACYGYIENVRRNGGRREIKHNGDINQNFAGQRASFQRRAIVMGIYEAILS